MSSPTPAIPGYRDFEMVAHGSTAFVYRAVQERLDRTVAVKVLLVDDEMTTADSVEKELEATVAVSNHPHIVSIIDTGTSEDGRPYIVMEYCDGGSYSAILKAGGPLPVDDVIDVGVKIGLALQAAHSADILHRDVKPQNLLRGQYGPALADFGIARAPAALSATEAIDKLTPLHASPEALLRQAQTPASDLFSLASTMWHLLAGFAPFANPEGGTDPDTHRARVTSEAPPPKIPREDLPEWLEDLLVRALSRDPNRRPESCQAFAEELQRGMYGSAGGVGKAQAPSRIADVSNEETVFRPEGPPPSQRAPLDPFAPVGPPPGPDSAYTLGSGATGGRTDGYASQLGHAVDPRYVSQLDGSAPVSSVPQAQASAPPISAAPHSVPPQAPVSMRPPMTPWMHQQAPAPAPQQQPPVFAPPVITRDNEKRPSSRALKAPKAPKPHDERSLKPYVILGSVITVVLALVMVGWLWLISPNGDAGDLDPADLDGEGAPKNVAIDSWVDGQIALSWEAPTEEADLEYFVTATRVGDDMAEPLGEPTTDTEFTAGGLSPAEDYCFRVTAVWAVDNVPTSDPVCTDDE
ncbi:protein kinase domain-containing protein [Glycomyces arizonensis]|uniref:protein kinase domain-containing protein n=1 Tax=Glycomyces arizonensis TaxID=256035 RepID=UPI0012EC5A39|nr:protein kinase [Glycomyces arizonensis]